MLGKLVAAMWSANLLSYYIQTQVIDEESAITIYSSLKKIVTQWIIYYSKRTIKNQRKYKN
jgi:hypothetical protein